MNRIPTKDLAGITAKQFLNLIKHIYYRGVRIFVLQRNEMFLNKWEGFVKKQKKKKKKKEKKKSPAYNLFTPIFACYNGVD